MTFYRQFHKMVDSKERKERHDPESEKIRMRDIRYNIQLVAYSQKFFLPLLPTLIIIELISKFSSSSTLGSMLVSRSWLMSEAVLFTSVAWLATISALFTINCSWLGTSGQETKTKGNTRIRKDKSQPNFVPNTLWESFNETIST